VKCFSSTFCVCACVHSRMRFIFAVAQLHVAVPLICQTFVCCVNVSYIIGQERASSLVSVHWVYLNFYGILFYVCEM
jgi:hypothetical protein